MYKITYFDTPFWSVAAAAEKGRGGGGVVGMLADNLYKHHVIHLFNNAKPLHVVPTLYNSRKRQILPENSSTKRDNSLLLCILVTTCCKYWGVTSMVMLCQDWSQQVEHMQVPKGRDQVSGVVGKYRFWDSSTREQTLSWLSVYCGEEVRCEGVGVEPCWGMTMTDKWFRYPVYPKTPILSAYNTTKRDNSSCWPDTVYCGEEDRQSPVLGCYIYSYIIYNLNLSQYHYLPSKVISLCKKKLKKSCTSQELWPSVL